METEIIMTLSPGSRGGDVVVPFDCEVVGVHTTGGALAIMPSNALKSGDIVGARRDSEEGHGEVRINVRKI